MFDVKVEWLLKGEPREVQQEALLRAFYGYKRRDRFADEPKLEQIRPNGYARGFNYFMEMRLGKTPTALNEFMLLKKYEGFTKLLVVSPQSFKGTWATEAEKFGVDVPTHVVELVKYKRTEEFLKQNKSFMVVVNYEALKCANGVRLLQAVVDDKCMVIFDESVLLKNPTGHSLKNVLGYVTPKAGALRCMTGMPIVQGPHDVWGQMRASDTLSKYTNFFAFRHQFCMMGGFQSKQVKGAKNVEELQSIINANSFKAFKHEWLTLPGIEFVNVPIEMQPEQMRMYQQMLEEDVLSIDESVITADLVITRAIKLQQITSGVVLDDDGNRVKLVTSEKNNKLQHLKWLISQTKGKIIVVAVFSATMDMLIEELAEYQPAVIRGKTDKDVISEDKQRFNTDPKCRVLIGQSQALKYGHTLMGDVDDPCLTTVFYENSYSLDVRTQCEQRNQGVGQQGEISIYDFVASGMDAKVITALQAKLDLSDAIMEYKLEREFGL